VLSIPSSPEAMPLRELVKELLANTSALVQRQVKLAADEGKNHAKRGRKSLALLAVAAALGYGGLVVLAVAAALAVGAALDRPWLGALIVGGALLVFAGAVAAVGWSRRVRVPLRRSREELQRELTWAKHLRTT
jgi:hypothetical protein